MTSKNLCFKLMKEDVKRRAWTIALTVLGLVFTILVPVAIKSGEFRDYVAHVGPGEGSNYIQNSIIGFLRTGGGAVTVLILASVVWAVSGFHYLHNSRKVDFYHSLPIKRRQIFLAVYMNGILIPAGIYLMVLLLAVGIALQAGVGMDVIGVIPFQGFAMHLVYYSLLYTTTVLAMMLTGNVVVALLGTVVFYSYGPAVIALVLAYFNSWFHTFTMSAAQDRRYILMLWYSSPFGNYMGSVGDFNTGLWYINRILTAGLVTVFLAGISYLLYRVRPSEAAGKAMAFKTARAPIKVLLVIPISVAFGMFFYMLRSHLTWLVFGTLCGCVLSHCLIEIIYHFDFRRLFAHKLHLAGCGGVSLVLLLAGYYDWYGYDSWVPDAGKVESAAICLYDKDEWVTYGQADTIRSGNGKVRYYWNYKNRADYCYENMNMTDASLAMEVSRRGAEADQARRRDKNYRAYNSDVFMVQFRMKNGKVVQRRYSIPVDEEETRLVCAIHDNEEYKQGAYPVMKQTREDTMEVFVQQFGQTEELLLDSEARGHLLETYQEEWKNLTAETREKEFPIGIIQFNTVDMVNAREEYKAQLEKEGKTSYYFDVDLAERCYYPIYPSFDGTLALLADAGYTFVPLEEWKVSKIRIERLTVYDDRYVGDDGEMSVLYEGGVRDYEDEEDLNILIPALCYQNYSNMGGGFYSRNLDYDTLVTVYLEDSDRTFGFYLDLNRLSSEEAEWYGLHRGTEG